MKLDGLDGKAAIITGGGAGIGRGISLCLAGEGADIAIADINGENARAVAGEVEALGRKSVAIEADITDGDNVAQVVAEVLSTFGKIDILVNNIGSTGEAMGDRTDPHFSGLEEWEWDKTIKRNLKTQYLMCKAVVPHFQKQRSGKIVNMASQAAKSPQRRVSAYSTAKAAVVHFSHSLALELAKDNINVNCVCPGLVFTDSLYNSMSYWMKNDPRPEVKDMDPREYFRKYTAPSIIPLQREQTVEDVARAVAFLVSDNAKNITAQALSVDGGMVPG